MYSEKPEYKHKNDTPKRNTWRILFGFALVVCAMALAIFAYQMLYTPKIDLSGVTTVEIHDPLWEYSFDVPPTTTYMLKMVDGELVGQHSYMATPVSSMEITDVQVPADAVTTFLTALEQVELVKAPPSQNLADIEPYPSLQMIFRTDGAEIMFYTSPKVGDQVKWSALINGQYYDINSEIPMEALDGISTYLQRDPSNSVRD